MDEEKPAPVDWRRWTREHGRRFLLFARQQARHEADAEDLVQEALVEAWERSHGELPAPALVFATIRRRAIDLARRDDRRRQRELHDEAAKPEWFESEAEMNELREALETGLRGLSPDQREVVTLKMWGDLTFEEVGTVLDISPNTAASRYRYALEALRKNLKPLLT